MFEFLASQPPAMQALLGTLFTWFLTALGAAVVFFFKKMNKKLLDAMLGFAAGVMIAASFFSLIAPAVELTEAMGQPFVPVQEGPAQACARAHRCEAAPGLVLSREQQFPLTVGKVWQCVGIGFEIDGLVANACEHPAHLL